MRGFAPERTRKCGVVRRGKSSLAIGSTASGSRSCRWSGMVTCQSVHACPVCAKRIRAKRAAQVRAAVEEGRARCTCHGCMLARRLRGERKDMPSEARCTGPRWRMVTVTIRHDVALPLKLARTIVMAAYRRARQQRSVRSIFDDKVRASIRAVEVTRGPNGWHPHLHILLLTDEWTIADKLALELAFATYVKREADKAGVLSARVAPSRGVGVRWSNGYRTDAELTKSEYLAKLGWELSGAGKGDPQFRIADKAVTSPASRLHWNEYVTAMRGVRAIECDERAAQLASNRATSSAGEDATVVIDERHVEIGPMRLQAMRDAERLRPTITRDVLVAVAIRAGPDDDSVYAAFDAEVRSCYEPARRGMVAA